MRLAYMLAQGEPADTQLRLRGRIKDEEVQVGNQTDPARRRAPASRRPALSAGEGAGGSARVFAGHRSMDRAERLAHERMLEFRSRPARGLRGSRRQGRDRIRARRLVPLQQTQAQWRCVALPRRSVSDGS